MAARKKAVSATTETKQRSLQNLIPFQPGQSGNPKGRAKGSRHKLGEAFLSALHDDFEKHGVEVIEKVRDERPHEYLKVVASILPKELNVTTNAVEELSDDELAAGIAALQSILAAQEDASGGAAETKH
jgi:hypothetical protein